LQQIHTIFHQTEANILLGPGHHLLCNILTTLQNNFPSKIFSSSFSYFQPFFSNFANKFLSKVLAILLF